MFPLSDDLVPFTYSTRWEELHTHTHKRLQHLQQRPKRSVQLLFQVERGPLRDAPSNNVPHTPFPSSVTTPNRAGRGRRGRKGVSRLVAVAGAVADGFVDDRTSPAEEVGASVRLRQDDREEQNVRVTNAAVLVRGDRVGACEGRHCLDLFCGIIIYIYRGGEEREYISASGNTKQRSAENHTRLHTHTHTYVVRKKKRQGEQYIAF